MQTKKDFQIKTPKIHGLRSSVFQNGDQGFKSFDVDTPMSDATPYIKTKEKPSKKARRSSFSNSPKLYPFNESSASPSMHPFSAKVLPVLRAKDSDEKILKKKEYVKFLFSMKTVELEKEENLIEKEEREIEMLKKKRKEEEEIYRQIIRDRVERERREKVEELFVNKHRLKRLKMAKMQQEKFELELKRTLVSTPKSNKNSGNKGKKSFLSLGSPISRSSFAGKTEGNQQKTEKSGFQIYNKSETTSTEKGQDYQDSDKITNIPKKETEPTWKQNKKDQNDENLSDEKQEESRTIAKRRLKKPSDRPEEIVSCLLKELSTCIETSDYRPIEINEGKNSWSLAEYINNMELLLDYRTYLSPKELNLEEAEKIKSPLIEIVYEYFNNPNLAGNTKSFNQAQGLNFDIADLDGFTPLGVAIEGGMKLASGSLDSVGKILKPLISLANLAKCPIYSHIRKGNMKYSNLYDIFLRFILSPLPYQEELKIESIFEKIKKKMDLLRNECTDILQKLDKATDDSKDLAQAIFNPNSQEVYNSFIMLVPKLFEGDKQREALGKFDSIRSKYESSQLDSSFWNGSSILAFAGKDFLKQLLKFLGDNKLVYSPLKINPISGAYAFVWNEYEMSVAELSIIMQIAERSEEKINFSKLDDFGFSFLQYAKIGKGLLELANEKNIDLSLISYKIYNEQENNSIKEKKNKLLRWGKETENKNLEYLMNVKDSYFYKTIVNDFCQRNIMEKLEKFDIPDLLLAQIARKICDVRQKSYDYKSQVERVEKIHVLITYLESKKRKIDLKHFYEGGEICRCNDKGHEKKDGLSDFLLVATDDTLKNDSQLPIHGNSIKIVNYAEMAIAIHALSQDKDNSLKKLETLRNKSKWADLCAGCIQKLQNSSGTSIQSFQQTKTISQILSDLAIRATEDKDRFKAYLDFGKANDIKIEMKTEFNFETMLERVMGAKDASSPTSSFYLLKDYIKSHGIEVRLKDKNRIGDRIVETLRDDPGSLQLLANNLDLFDPKEDATLEKCDLLRRCGKQEEALKMLESKPNDPDYLLLKAKIKEETNEEESKVIYNTVQTKFSEKKNDASLALALLKYKKNKEEGINTLNNIQGSADYTLLLVTFNKISMYSEAGQTDKVAEVISEGFKELEKRPEYYDNKTKNNFVTKLMATLKALISTPHFSLKEGALKQLIASVVKDMNNNITSKDIVKKYEDQIAALKARLDNAEEILKYSGMKDMAEVNKIFAELKEKKPVAERYARTFFWTLTNFFDSARILSTGMVQENKEYSLTKEKTANQICNSYREHEGIKLEKTSDFEFVKKVGSFCAKLAEDVPYVGVPIKMVNAAVGYYIDSKEEVKRHNQITALTRVTQLYMPEDLKITLLKASVNTAKDKKSFKAPEESSFFKKLEQKYSFLTKLRENCQKLKQKFEDIRDKIIGTKINLYEKEECNAAHQDALAALIYIATDYKSITEYNLAQIIHDVVIQAEEQAIMQAESATEEPPKIDPKKEETTPKPKSSCCQMFAVYKIIYDDPIINALMNSNNKPNNPKLLSYLLSDQGKFGEQGSSSLE